MQTQLVNSDCIKHLKTLDDNIFDSCVTDPPYHLASIVKRFGPGQKGINNQDTKDGRNGPFHNIARGFMGQVWDGGDIAFTTEIWKEVYRTLKPGAYLLAFSAPRNYHRMAIAIEDSGFEIRDQIMWIFGSGFPKSHNVGKQIDKKLGNTRIKTGQVKTHARKGIAVAEERTAINAGSFGQEVEEEITVGTSEWEGWGTALKPAHEPIVMARKPIDGSVANNVLKHRTGAINIDESRVELSEDDNLQLGRFPANLIHDGLEEEWAKYFYCSKASKKEKADTKHPTVKPVALMRYLVKLITPKQGIVLDPFAGTGTTGEACILESKKYYLIEAKPSYFKDIETRLNRYSGLGI